VGSGRLGPLTLITIEVSRTKVVGPKIQEPQKKAPSEMLLQVFKITLVLSAPNIHPIFGAFGNLFRLLLVANSWLAPNEPRNQGIFEPKAGFVCAICVCCVERNEVVNLHFKRAEALLACHK